MKKNSNNLFWISFSDVMTSLFFVVLVLYVLTYVMLKKQQNNLLVENEKLNQILKLEQQFKPLQNDNDFIYLKDCKKYISKTLSKIEIFEPNKTTIKKKYQTAAINVGKQIESLLQNLNTNNTNFSYLIIIEGNMANTWDKKYNKNNNYGYNTSYKRALAVYQLWNRNNINLRQYNSEVLISGSGFNGLCRDKIEDNNKRFSVQIIPKIEYSN